MIFVSGFAGKKWPVILWCLASFFLLIFSLLTHWLMPSEKLFWLNLQAIEDNRIAWILSFVLMVWPAWRNLKLGAWLFLIPLLSSILLSMPLIQSGKLHREYFNKFGQAESFNFNRWILNETPNFRPIEFESTHNQKLTSLIYLPNQSSQPLPLLILLHGGGFYQGSPHWMHNWASAMCRHDIAVVSISYSLTPRSQFPTQINEIASTIKLLKVQLAKQNVDTNSVFIAGSSAGGTLALSTSITQPNLNIKGVIALYPITDFTKSFDSISDIEAIKRQYQGLQSDSSISPRFQIFETMPPVLLIHGEKDNIVSVEQSREFHQYLTAKKVESELCVLPWATHNFEYPIYGPSGQFVENATFHFIDRIIKK